MRVHHIILLSLVISGCSGNKDNLSPIEGRYFTNPISNVDVKGSQNINTSLTGDIKYRYGSADVVLSPSIYRVLELSSSHNRDIKIFSEPAFLSDGVVLMNDHGQIAKFDTKGKAIWRTNFSPKKSFCSNISITTNDVIAVASCGTNFVKAFDLAKGKEIWNIELDDAVSSNPIFAGDNLVFTSKNNSVYALHSTTGKLAWLVPNSVDGQSRTINHANLLAMGEHIIQQTANDQVRAINSHNGHVDAVVNIGNTMQFVKANESVAMGTGIAMDPRNKSIYLTNSDGVVVKVDKSFNIEWQADVMSSGSIWLIDDLVIGINKTGSVFALSAASGKMVWMNNIAGKLNPTENPKTSKQPYNKVMFSNPVVLNNQIVLLTSSNKMLCINPGNGELLKTQQFNQDIFGQPYVYNKQVYVLTNNGNRLIKL